MKTIGIVLIFLSLFIVPAYAGSTGEIELNDGSRIFGEILSVESGIFTVRSDVLGLVKVEQAKIRAIHYQREASSSPPSSPQSSPGKASGTGTDEIKSLRDAMMGDTEVMEMIAGMREDPDFQAVLEDPELMSAIQSGNISLLLSDPRFQRLLEKESVRNIEKRVNR